jgi:hypothetical protein
MCGELSHLASWEWILHHINPSVKCRINFFTRSEDESKSGVGRSSYMRQVFSKTAFPKKNKKKTEGILWSLNPKEWNMLWTDEQKFFEQWLKLLNQLPLIFLFDFLFLQSILFWYIKICYKRGSVAKYMTTAALAWWITDRDVTYVQISSSVLKRRLGM